MAQTYFSNILLKATPTLDQHVITKGFGDAAYMPIGRKATSSVLGGVTITTNGGIAVDDGAISIDVTKTKELLGLGTAAYANLAAMGGTSADSGKVAILGSDGKLAGAVMPDLAITEVFTATSADDETGGLLTKSGAKIGDVCIVTEDGVDTVYMLADSGANAYATLSNWKKLSIASGVVYSISANGQTAQDGAVELTFADFWNNDGETTYKITSLSTDPNDGNVSVASAEATYDAIQAVAALRAAKDGTTFGLISVASDAAGLSVTNGVLTTTAASTSAKGVVQLANDSTASGFASNGSDAATPKAVADYVASQTAAAKQVETFTSSNATAGADSKVITIDAALGQYPSVEIINGGNRVYADIAYSSTTADSVTTYKVTVSFESVASTDGAFTIILRK